MTDAKRETLRMLLVRAYWKCETFRDEALVRTLFLALGFKDPLYG